MPDYKDQEGAPGASKSPLSSLVRWLQIKKYQYEVTFSLYMLTSTEKIVFSMFSPLLVPIQSKPNPYPIQTKSLTRHGTQTSSSSCSSRS